jgi:hypothetical protein
MMTQTTIIPQSHHASNVAESLDHDVLAQLGPFFHDGGWMNGRHI